MDDPYNINGLYLHQLKENEFAWFQWQVTLKKARVEYHNGFAAMLGLGKVKLLGDR